MSNGCTKLQVIQCGKFMQDPKFASIKATIRQKPNGTVVPAVLTRLINCKCDTVDIQADCTRFLEDRFELIADMDGFSAENINCTVTKESLHIDAENKTCNRTMKTEKSYQLPQKVKTQGAECLLSADGIMVVTLLWG